MKFKLIKIIRKWINNRIKILKNIYKQIEALMKKSKLVWIIKVKVVIIAIENNNKLMILLMKRNNLKINFFNNLRKVMLWKKIRLLKI